MVEAAHRERGQGRHRREDQQERPEAREPDQEAAKEEPRRRTERDPEDVDAVLPVRVRLRVVLVIKAVDRDVEGVVGDADEEEQRGHAEDVADEAGQNEQGGDEKERAEDDLFHRQPVVDPARREGEDDGRRRVERDDEADGQSVEPEFHKMERGQEKDGRHRHRPDEIEGVDAAHPGHYSENRRHNIYSLFSKTGVLYPRVTKKGAALPPPPVRRDDCSVSASSAPRCR